jgi:hypothetical protein
MIGAQAQSQSQAKDYFMTGQPKNKGPVYIIATTRVYITQLVSNFLTPN